MCASENPASSDTDAIFVGWQNSGREIFPLFNIIAADHPLCNSTVTDVTLRKLQLRIPQTPSPYPETAPAPWHNQGINLNNPKTAREALHIAGLDYSVTKQPLGLQTSMKPTGYATMRMDTHEVLGFVNAAYEPVQNIDAFTFFDTLVAENEAIYETAGFFGKGERIWILARLTGYLMVHGNDLVNKYLLLTNSHDGSSQIRARVMPIRVICNNTLTAALQEAGDIPIRHMPDAVYGLEQALPVLRQSISLYEQLDVVFNSMASKKIADDQLREYVRALVPDNEERFNTARAEKIRDSVLHLHESGLGAHLARGTVWGAFNSVAEYTDHMMSGEDDATRLNSIWFGHGNQLKAKAFSLAERMMQA